MADRALPMVAIVGRPNVGKSALFNRLMRRRISIVHEQSGVTRDRIAAPLSCDGRHCLLVDTGGLGVPHKENARDVFDALIRDQAESVIEEAALILFVVDCVAGVTALDLDVAAFLRQSGRPVLVVPNKADNLALREAAHAEFAELGFPEVLPTSCTQNLGVPELLDALVAHLPESAGAAPESSDLRLAVVGRPNVGKSSLVNRLLGEDRVMVSEVAGTTRDAVDIPLRLRHGEQNLDVTLIDTAGLRRKRRLEDAVEFYSVARAERAIRRSDVVLFIIDATEPGTAQDRRIARYVSDAAKPCIVVVNKWDLVSGGMKQRDLRDTVRALLPFIAYAPVEIVCAASGYQVSRVVDTLFTVCEQMQITIPTAVLNRFLQDLTARTPPPAPGNRPGRILYATMTGSAPPGFVIFVNHRRLFSANYVQFIENRLRAAFFQAAGLPIRIVLRQRRDSGADQAGSRRAVSGVMRQRQAGFAAKGRHEARRKGWRKK